MFLNNRFVRFIIYWAVTLYAKTWRYKAHNREVYDKLRRENIRPVMAIWHDQLLPCTFFHRNEGMATIASDSRDGDLITYALDRWGFNTARGSSTRGGIKAALQSVSLSIKHNVPCAVTVDGPKGPRHKVKRGAVFIAKKLDKVILVGVMSCKHFIRFKSWDKFILPLPFAKINAYYSEPIYVSEGVSEEEIKADTEMLQKRMSEFTSESCPIFV